MRDGQKDVKAAVAAHNEDLDVERGFSWVVPVVPRGYRFMSLGEVRPVGYTVFDLDCPISGWVPGTTPGRIYQSNELFGEGLVLACPGTSAPKTDLTEHEQAILSRVTMADTAIRLRFEPVDWLTVVDLSARGFVQVVQEPLSLVLTEKGEAALESPRVV